MADHSVKVGFGLSTSQIVSSDFAPCVVTEQASILQEQSGGKHNRGPRSTSDWLNNRTGHHDAENAAAASDTKQLRPKKNNIFTTLSRRHANYLILLPCCVTDQCSLNTIQTLTPIALKGFCMFMPVTYNLYHVGVSILSSAWHCCTFIYLLFIFLAGGLCQPVLGEPDSSICHWRTFSFLCPPARSFLVLVQNFFHTSSNPHLAPAASPGNLAPLSFYDDAALQVAFFTISQ